MKLLTAARYAWAAPLTAVGLGAAALARMGGGRVVVRDGVVEATGGALTRLLPSMGIGMTPVAMAIGHVIVAVDASVLTSVRAHELAHVRQAERWGMFFPLAYVAASCAAVASGRHGYRDNRFEIEARAADLSAR